MPTGTRSYTAKPYIEENGMILWNENAFNIIQEGLLITLKYEYWHKLISLIEIFNIMRTLLLICAAILFIGVANLPIEYYTFLRIAITIGAIIVLSLNGKSPLSCG